MGSFLSIFTGSSVHENPGFGVSVAVEFSGKIPVSAYFSYKKNTSSQAADLNSIDIAIEKFKKDLIIYSKNIYAVNSFGLWLKKWKENDWKGKDNKPIKNKDIIKKISDKISSSSDFFEVVLMDKCYQHDFCSNMAKKILSDILSENPSKFEQGVIYLVNLPPNKKEVIDI